MGDVPQSDSTKIVDFANYQMAKNPGGIGNECTHFVYAALFEVKALDGALRKAANVDSVKVPYRWGRNVAFSEMIRGDIAQFTGHQQTTFIYSQPASSWATATMKRLPNHTGIVETRAEDIAGMFLQFEAHLTDPKYTKMQIRIGRVYYEPFAIMIPLVDLNQPSMGPVKQLAQGSLKDLAETVFWGALRTKYGITAKQAATLEKAARAGKAPADIGILFTVSVVKDSVKIFCPQMSNERRAMKASDLVLEKRKLIESMKKSGRAGGDSSGDQYHNDNKKQRIKDGSFDWTFI